MQFLKCNILDSLIKFEYITVLINVIHTILSFLRTIKFNFMFFLKNNVIKFWKMNL